jgi:hypothetical protein
MIKKPGVNESTDKKTFPYKEKGQLQEKMS